MAHPWAIIALLFTAVAAAAELALPQGHAAGALMRAELLVAGGPSQAVMGGDDSPRSAAKKGQRQRRSKGRGKEGHRVKNAAEQGKRRRQSKKDEKNPVWQDCSRFGEMRLWARQLVCESRRARCRRCVGKEAWGPHHSPLDNMTLAQVCDSCSKRCKKWLRGEQDGKKCR
mmetsp:Transcript_69510/g.201390  ORF Transcript_69510/g.201390 Transcript_69510/m.201390 type:complete len:171 (-) Transcript_69510:114-626(-)